MKREYDFAGGERGKFFRKRARSAFPQIGIGDVFVDREGFTIVVFPEGMQIDAAKLRTKRYGERVILRPINKRVILRPIKKKRTPVRGKPGLTRDYRETVWARARRDPAFRSLLGGYSRLNGRKPIKKRAPKI
jgi:hypothetical protein